MVLDPDFAANGYVYIYYTTAGAPMQNRLSRFTAAGNVAVPGSEVVLLDLPPIDLKRQPFHNGGGLHFGPDGKLYVGVGDHEDRRKAQDINSPFGKILRINKDGTIPADNPFFDRAQGLGKAVWALGLRNPYTFAFQPGTGRLFVNDVGEGTWEEVNDVVPGGNYGWPNVEGRGRSRRYLNPLYTYRHGDGPGQGRAVVGGVFYPTSGPFPEAYRGKYFVSEYVRGEIRVVDPATGSAAPFASGFPPFELDLDIAPDGSLYYLGRGVTGVETGLWRIAFAVDQPPAIALAPTSRVASIGHPTTFTVGASGSLPLSFQWQRDGVPIPGATAETYTLPAVSAGDQGARFRVVLTNAFGTATSPEAVLTTTANQPPQAIIRTPSPGAAWRPGRTIRFGGEATDPEDGVLPPSAFTWRVDVQHDEHSHPFLAPSTGSRDGSFRISRQRHDPGTVWYRITLTVSDSAGLTSTATTDLKKVRIV